MTVLLNHLLGLLTQSLANTPTRIGSNWGSVIFTIAVVSIVLLLKGPGMKAHWRDNVKTGFYGAVIGWVGLFLISIVLTIYDDHQNMVAAIARIKRTDQMLLRSAAELNQEKQNRMKGDLIAGKVAYAALEGKTQTLDKQNRDQQNTINGYVVAIAKNIVSKRISVHTSIASVPLQNDKGRVVALIAQPTQSVARTSVRLHCSGSYQLLNVAMSVTPGRVSMTAGEFFKQESPSDSIYELSTPPWPENVPLLFYVFVPKNVDLGDCSVSQQ